MKNTGSDIKFIKGVGKKRAELLNRLGVFSSDDLFYFFTGA
jgi:predicted flap endonuclease-1-like 5' DNA nuclease